MGGGAARPRRRRRGCSLAGTMCRERRPPAGAGGEQGPRRARRKPGSRVTHEGREPAAGLTKAAGETVHLAGNAPGSGLSGAGASFSTPTERRPRNLTRLSSASSRAASDSRRRRPPVSPSARGVSRSTRLRAAPPAACPTSLSEAAAASAAPRPRARAQPRLRPRARRHASDPAPPHVMERDGASRCTPLPLPGLRGQRLRLDN